MRRLMLNGALLMISILMATPSYAAKPLSGDLVIFHAGSLTVPIAEMEKDFEAIHPGVDIKRTAGGSTKMDRLII